MVETFDPHHEDPARGFLVSAWVPANTIELAKRWRLPRFSYTHVSIVAWIVVLILWQRPSLLGSYDSDELRRALPVWVALFGGLSSLGVIFMLYGRWAARRWRATIDWRNDRVTIQRISKRIEFPVSAIDGVELRGWWHEGRKTENTSGGARRHDFFLFKVVLLLTDQATGSRRAVALMEPESDRDTKFSVESRARRGTAFPELGEDSLSDDLRDPVRKFLRDQGQDPRDVMVIVRQRERLDRFAAALAGALDVTYLPLVGWQEHGVARPE